MKIIIITIIAFLNIFTVCMIYKMLEGMKTTKKLGIIIIAEIIMFTLVNIIYTIASKGIDNNIVYTSKKLLIFTFVPLNLMIMFSGMAKQLAKYEANEINSENLKRKIITYFIIDMIILIFECIYVRNIQIGTINMINDK